MKTTATLLQPPKISIVIPCYNHSAYLTEAVESVLESSYKNLEIIIIDDGSIDDSYQVALSLASKYSEKVTAFSQANAGPACARNYGITKASGSYILPLDADDKISADYIETALKAFEEDHNLKVVYCEAEKFGLKNGSWKLKPFCREALALDNMIFISAIFKKSDWQKIGGFESSMTYGWEDWEFWINLLKSGGQVKRLSIVGFFYRIHTHSRRKSVDKKAKLLTIQCINRKHRSFLKKHLGGPLRNPRSWSKRINYLEQTLSSYMPKKAQELIFGTL